MIRKARSMVPSLRGMGCVPFPVPVVRRSTPPAGAGSGDFVTVVPAAFAPWRGASQRRLTRPRPAAQGRRHDQRTAPPPRTPRRFTPWWLVRSAARPVTGCPRKGHRRGADVLRRRHRRGRGGARNRGDPEAGRSCTPRRQRTHGTRAEREEARGRDRRRRNWFHLMGPRRGRKNAVIVVQMTPFYD